MIDVPFHAHPSLHVPRDWVYRSRHDQGWRRHELMTSRGRQRRIQRRQEFRRSDGVAYVGESGSFGAGIRGVLSLRDLWHRTFLAIFRSGTGLKKRDFFQVTVVLFYSNFTEKIHSNAPTLFDLF